MSFGIQGVGSSNAGSNEYPSIFSHSPTKDQPGKVAVILRVAKMQNLSPTELKKRIDAVLKSTQKAHVEAGQKAQTLGTPGKQASSGANLTEPKSSGRPGRHHSGVGGGNASGTLPPAWDATNGADSVGGGKASGTLPPVSEATNATDVTVGGQSLQKLQKALVAMQQHRQFIPSFAQMPKDT